MFLVIQIHKSYISYFTSGYYKTIIFVMPVELENRVMEIEDIKL